ncbi:Prolyl oligopeptidase family protein [hydrothermal vent metagenome]|uniref:Prolyl oligopeptidase family protein n=1 Tax=hydrothermal vent metagenome TaxID=652676 RepID=A0A3B0YRZ6_9ZZZZ
MSKKIQPFGSWSSSINAENLVSGQINPSQIQFYDKTIYWLEPRPEEKGRLILNKRTLNSEGEEHTEIDLLGPDKSVRSQVHEYGGSAYQVFEQGIIFVNHSDQQLYKYEHNGSCTAITTLEHYRFTDIQISSDSQHLICICEQHLESEHEPYNSLISVDISTGEYQTLAEDDDFYASPKLFQCTHDKTAKLCWISWSHPDMPWDHTRLWTADFEPNGTVSNIKCVRNNPGESIFQPLWSPDGTLYFVSDISDWWNIYSIDNEQALIAMSAEFGLPQWVFGMSTYGFIDSETIGCSYIQNGDNQLATIDIKRQVLTTIKSELTFFDQICTGDDCLWFIGASPTLFPAIYRYSLHNKLIKRISVAAQWQPDINTISVAQAIDYDTSHHQKSHAYFYPPVNPLYADSDELPPLIVMSHGGPTTHANNSLSLKIQFWTSRGFAVCDVNYRGSTGYGRPYRDALKSQWGIYDVDDCIYAARYLVEQKLVDPDKLAIRGGSAGGFSVLSALTFHNTFKAGASYYGISDLAVLAKDTHKFEARYLDRLVGPWPEAQDIYIQRSPINSVDKLNCPVIFFQGLKDKVVPPNQAELMVKALCDKKVPVAHITYADEQHGFRQATTIVHSLHTELLFYGKVFGFTATCEVNDDQGTESIFYNQ